MFSTEPKLPMPAFATTTSIPPNRAIPARTTSSIASSERTSATWATARSSPTFATVAASPASSTSHSTSRAPREARVSAVAAPMPLPAPVMRTTLASSDGGGVRLDFIRAVWAAGSSESRIVPTCSGT